MLGVQGEFRLDVLTGHLFLHFGDQHVLLGVLEGTLASLLLLEDAILLGEFEA